MRLNAAVQITYGRTTFLVKGSTIRFCRRGFAKTKSTPSLITSSMDSFIKIIPEKKHEKVNTIHENKIALIRSHIERGKNVFICGAIGVGKSFILKEALRGLNSVELLAEHLKSKSLFLPFIRPSTKHVFIEDYEPTFKATVESVSDGNRLSRGVLLVTTTNMCMYPNFETVFIPRHPPEVLLKLVDKVTPEAEVAARSCKGNIRSFFNYVDGYDHMDDFQSPKEFITDILCDTGPLVIHDSISEHGHCWDIFQENYPNSMGVDLSRTAASFSDADFFDTHIYKHGSWFLMPYFVLHALTIPKSSLGQPLERDRIRPGSCWTKLGNYKMRKSKYDAIRKKSRVNLGVEELCLLKTYAEKGNLDPLFNYKINPQDFDVINHLCVGSNLKPREVSRIKKQLKNVYERR